VLSSAYGEAFPNVVAEAMACETPCIVTEVGDSALIVGDTGWVVPSSDPAGLATAMAAAIQALSDRAELKNRQTKCRERIEANFNLQIRSNGINNCGRVVSCNHSIKQSCRKF
jgi:glycosyltransferase involved in cell wall biosynthesis